MVRDVIDRATRGVRLPFELAVEERLAMLPVLDVSTQFRVVQTSVGHWAAAGGYKNGTSALTELPVQPRNVLR